MNGCKDCLAFAKCTETYHGSCCAALRCVAAEYCRLGHTGMIDWLRKQEEGQP